MDKFQDCLDVDERILDRFTIIDILGRGAYGIVWKVKEKVTGQCYALKKIYNAFQNSRNSQRTYREAMSLELLSAHKNVVSLKEIINSKNNKDLYLLFEQVETDLQKYLQKMKQEKTQMNSETIRQIIYQVCCGLAHLHKHSFIHRDLKPSNILIQHSSELEVKLCDFGCCRYCHQQENNLTDYVATRWYRAPEMILGSNSYTSAVDIWGLGCLLSELYLGQHLFPGTSSIDQFQKIVCALGKPKQEDVENMRLKLQFSQIDQIQVQKGKTLSVLLKTIPPVAQDFIRKCLEYSPHKRPSIQLLMKHKLIKDFSDAQNQQQELADPLILYGLDDSKQYPIKFYRELIYNSIEAKKKQQKLKQKQLIQSQEIRAMVQSQVISQPYYTNQNQGSMSMSQLSLLNRIEPSFSIQINGSQLLEHKSSQGELGQQNLRNTFYRNQSQSKRVNKRVTQQEVYTEGNVVINNSKEKLVLPSIHQSITNSPVQNRNLDFSTGSTNSPQRLVSGIKIGRPPMPQKPINVSLNSPQKVLMRQHTQSEDFNVPKIQAQQEITNTKLLQLLRPPSQQKQKRRLQQLVKQF